MPTVDQISAGGVAFRQAPAEPSDNTTARIEIAVILVGPQARWQLPKGLVNAGESPETAALREVAEEAGIKTRLLSPLNVIEYWYYGTRGKSKVRFHKRVHFFLLAYVAGDVADHDDEVVEARWVSLADAKAMLAFSSERKVVEQAEALLAGNEGGAA